MFDIIVNGKRDKQEIYLLENGNLVENIKKQKSIEGNIYLGKVQNILPGMQAAFIDIGETKNTYIHLKDVLPKIDETKQIQENNKSIKEIIKPGMKILVQVKRSDTNKKGARVSTHISLTGRYTVIMPNTSIITVSQKIEEKAEQDRLKEIAKSILPENMGVILRTSAKGKTEEEISKDVDNLKRKWAKIEKTVSEVKECPILLEENNGILTKLLLDLSEQKIRSIVANDRENYEEIKNILIEQEETKIDVKLLEGKDLVQEYGIQTQIERAENRKVWLKCGGFIAIDKTEALTAIDVNSGKYIGTKDLEQTVFTVNKEATIEIAKQLKLRDVGGIVIIDYIDMENKESKQKIENLLKEELKKDRSKTQVMGFTKLNLLEMTRKQIS